MARLLFRPAAISDLTEIAEYIERRTPGCGFAFIDEIRKSSMICAETPFAGQGRPEIGKGLRSFVHGNYVVFYRPLSDGIAVVRVLHGKRDIRRLF